MKLANRIFVRQFHDPSRALRTITYATLHSRKLQTSRALQSAPERQTAEGLASSKETITPHEGGDPPLDLREDDQNSSPSILYYKLGPSAIQKYEDVTGLQHIFLRDSCTCSQCVDPSTKQKTFQTTDIPSNIKARAVKTLENDDVEMQWRHDIEGFSRPGHRHVSRFSKEFLKLDSPLSPYSYEWHWTADQIETRLGVVDYDDYMTQAGALNTALRNLSVYGLVIIKGVPESEKSVENIGTRIGTLRDTFYGRTWDVKSKPQAKNVAYTPVFLGLHMDLLYMANPPGFQLLHCLKNSCKGGTSLFSDAYRAAISLPKHDFEALSSPKHKIPYHYNNDGQYYSYAHQVIETSESPSSKAKKPKIASINYSPPFQAPFITAAKSKVSWSQDFLPAFRKFAKAVENPKHLFKYRLAEGECVIFNNRRILHGRTAFDASGGERWLKGAYVDADVFESRWRVLHEQLDRPASEDVLKDNRWSQKPSHTRIQEISADASSTTAATDR